MEVILADYLGFCYGVKRAIKIARENASEDGTACTLGPIIHNPQMVDRLRREGVGSVDSLEEMESGTVIIRSHGVGPQVYEEAERRGLEVVDATCPHVKKAQLSAKALVDEGYPVIIIGEKITRRSGVSMNGLRERRRLLRQRRRQMPLSPRASSASCARRLSRERSSVRL